MGLGQVGLPGPLEGEAGVRVQGEGLLEARNGLVYLADLALDRADLARGGRIDNSARTQTSDTTFAAPMSTCNFRSNGAKKDKT